MVYKGESYGEQGPLNNFADTKGNKLVEKPAG